LGPVSAGLGLSFEKLPRFDALAAVCILMAAQLVTVPHANPPARNEIPAPPRIEALLRRACYDCHSNETRWPWYSHIAPFSWWMAHDVAAGRREINFSEWGSYYPATRMRKLEWLGRSLREQTMPPWTYCIAHPGASLSDEERTLLTKWVESEIPRSSPSTSSAGSSK
jgi:hypothetical protein